MYIEHEYFITYKYTDNFGMQEGVRAISTDFKIKGMDIETMHDYLKNYHNASSVMITNFKLLSRKLRLGKWKED